MGTFFNGLIDGFLRLVFWLSVDDYHNDEYEDHEDYDSY